MSATYLVITDSEEHFSVWSAQVPVGSMVTRLDDPAFARLRSARLPLVVILDGLKSDLMPDRLDESPMVVIGEPGTVGFEDLRLDGKAVKYFSYSEAKAGLASFLPLLGEIAEARAALSAQIGSALRRSDSMRPFSRANGLGENLDVWDFIEASVENITSRERLLSEFRRASRYLLSASYVVFFLRDETGFRADRGTSSFGHGDPLVKYLSTHPAVLDGEEWFGPPDQVAELAVRNRMALFGARLLVPMHENGHLVGVIAYGVRDNGQPYDEQTKARAVFLARLLRQFLSQSEQVSRYSRHYQKSLTCERYLPQWMILGPNDEAPRQAPLIVRSLIGEVRQQRETRTARPEAGQPFRARAGIVEETGGVWCYWEEASHEVTTQTLGERRTRMQLLRSLALTLNHQLGNALVSLKSLKHHIDNVPLPPGLISSVKTDLARLEQLNVQVTLMEGLAEARPERLDLRELVKQVAANSDIDVAVGPEPVWIDAVGSMLIFAFTGLVDCLKSNRPEGAVDKLTIELRSTGSGKDTTGLVSIQGTGLELEGILPQPGDEDVPNLGRLDVFIAKEILQLHMGEIHAGPGLKGTEILVSIRQW